MAKKISRALTRVKNKILSLTTKPSLMSNAQPEDIPCLPSETSLIDVQSETALTTDKDPFTDIEIVSPSTTGATLTESHLFPKLPVDVSVMIWALTFPVRRIIHLHTMDGPDCDASQSTDNYVQLQWLSASAYPTMPIALQICQESRYEALRSYQLCFSSGATENSVTPKLYVNFKRDYFVILGWSNYVTRQRRARPWYRSQRHPRVFFRLSPKLTVAPIDIPIVAANAKSRINSDIRRGRSNRKFIAPAFAGDFHRIRHLILDPKSFDAQSVSKSKLIAQILASTGDDSVLLHFGLPKALKALHIVQDQFARKSHMHSPLEDAEEEEASEEDLNDDENDLARSEARLEAIDARWNNFAIWMWSAIKREMEEDKWKLMKAKLSEEFKELKKSYPMWKAPALNFFEVVDADPMLGGFF